MSKHHEKNKNDNIFGTYGGDYLDGGPGNDYIQSFPANNSPFGDKADFISGGPGDDTLLAGDGNDTVYGGPGNDLIWGGAGNDHMWGGPGADVFQFSVDRIGGSFISSGGTGTNNRDVIEDFRQGTDNIDLQYWINSPAVWVGEDQLPNESGELGSTFMVGFHYEEDNTIVDLRARQFPYTVKAEIELSGHIALNQSDFIF